MEKIILGMCLGLAFGILDVLVMVPMKFENNRKRWEAMGAAFIERFMIGFLVPNVALGIHPVLSGLFLGTALSLPSALITRAHVPIVGIGAIGGMAVGVFIEVLQ